MNTKERIELLSDGFIADIIRARNANIPKEILKTQMAAAEEAAMELFHKRYILAVENHGKSVLSMIMRIIAGKDSIYKQVQQDLSTAIAAAAKLNINRNQKYLEETDLDFNARIDSLSQQPIKGNSCLKHPMEQIMKELMREHNII